MRKSGHDVLREKSQGGSSGTAGHEPSLIMPPGARAVKRDDPRSGPGFRGPDHVSMVQGATGRQSLTALPVLWRAAPGAPARPSAPSSGSGTPDRPPGS